MSGTSGSVSTAAPDREFEILCDDNGAFLRRYTVDSTGTTAPVDTLLDGTTAYTVAGAVTRCQEQAAPNPQVASTAQRQTGAGTVNVAAGARSVTFMVFAGAPTVSIAGGAAVPFPAGSTATWSVDRGGDAGEGLADAFAFTGVAGSDFAVLTTREV
ncbi:hypothetical protein F5972_08130 [Microbispora cellulosiformans]|uniref:Uncharacterized protein n=1 Tax=Microbispora cellulosiformans TaxID=2614688 RepID=A0A5J5K7E9_9ACTN|nr:hypothetical protein [Microbispora cellulosiformans]KAA9379614.1 hypothetical protein F5972_08130 [Microbispora cellulosiformans]